MDLRIPNENVAATGASQAGRTAETSRSAGHSGNSSAVLSGGEDRVEISSLSERISAAGNAQESQQADRVRQLAALYRGGKYQVDSVQVSRAMVNQAFSSGAGEIGRK